MRVAPRKLVNSVEVVSSRRMRQEFPDLRRHHWKANRLRSGSYFAWSVEGARSRRPATASTSSHPLAVVDARYGSSEICGGGR
jgi:Transposase IS200 like